MQLERTYKMYNFKYKRRSMCCILELVMTVFFSFSLPFHFCQFIGKLDSFVSGKMVFFQYDIE